MLSEFCSAVLDKRNPGSIENKFMPIHPYEIHKKTNVDFKLSKLKSLIHKVIKSLKIMLKIWRFSVKAVHETNFLTGF